MKNEMVVPMFRLYIKKSLSVEIEFWEAKEPTRSGMTVNMIMMMNGMFLYTSSIYKLYNLTPLIYILVRLYHSILTIGIDSLRSIQFVL